MRILMFSRHVVNKSEIAVYYHVHSSKIDINDGNVVWEWVKMNTSQEDMYWYGYETGQIGLLTRNSIRPYFFKIVITLFQI